MGEGGGHPKFKISPVSKRNMGSSSPRSNHSYCRVPSQRTERDRKFMGSSSPRWDTLTAEYLPSKLHVTEDLWDQLLQGGITLTEEYLPSKLNVTEY